MTRSAQIVPWGNDSVGATYVRTNWANTGAGVKIAVIDDGVYCTNPDLTSRVKGGYDFVRDTSDYCGAADFHGTSVAGILAAENDGGGVVGVAPGASLYVLRVCDISDCYPLLIEAALRWAHDSGMQVVNASLGDCGSDVYGLFTDNFIANDIAALASNGVPAVFAAGNGTHTEPTPCPANSPVSWLASRPGAIAVQAHGQNDTYGSGYQFGSSVAFSGPAGVVADSGTGLAADVFNGSSAATPYVAGSFALLIGAGFEGLDTLFRRLKETAVNPDGPGHDDFYGWGMVRADLAAVPPPNILSVSWCTDGNITSTSQLDDGYCTFTPSTTNGVPPLQYRYVITVGTDTTLYDWASGPRDILIPTGTYRMGIYVDVRDSVYRRFGFGYGNSLSVCDDGGGMELRGVSPDLPSGCTSGGGDELRARSRLNGRSPHP